jgi:hypothetical protein
MSDVMDWVLDLFLSEDLNILLQKICETSPEGRAALEKLAGMDLENASEVDQFAIVKIRAALAKAKGEE